MAKSRSRATTSSSAAAASARSSSSCRPSSSSPAAAIRSCAAARRWRCSTCSPKREWIGDAARDELGAAYQFLRTLEHRLQMVADEQTHTLPGDREGLERFARFCRLCRSRQLRRSAARPPAQCAAPLCDPVRKRARCRGARPRARVPARCRRPRDPRQADRDGIQAAARSLGAGAALACGRLPVTAGRACPRHSLRSWCRCCSPISPAPRIRTPRSLPSTASCRGCMAPAGCSRCCGRIPT